jgi:hypothetical protein
MFSPDFAQSCAFSRTLFSPRGEPMKPNHAPVVSTTRNRAFPLIMRPNASSAFSSE